MTCAVLFNLDGTLTDNTVDYKNVYYEALSKAGIEGLDDTYESYTDRFFNYFQNGWAFPRRHALLDLLDEHNMDDIGLTDAFGDAWEELEAEHTSFRADAADVIRELATDHTVGIITNGTSELQRTKLRDGGIADHLDAVIISSEIGKTKPNANFFEEAQAAVEADTYVVVSHDLRRDLLPAKRLDMKTVWLGNDPGDNPQIQQLIDAQVSSLAELPDVIDELCNA